MEDLVHISQVRTELGKISFSYNSPCAWNNLQTSFNLVLKKKALDVKEGPAISLSCTEISIKLLHDLPTDNYSQKCRKGIETLNVQLMERWAITHDPKLAPEHGETSQNDAHWQWTWWGFPPGGFRCKLDADGSLLGAHDRRRQSGGRGSVLLSLVLWCVREQDIYPPVTPTELISYQWGRAVLFWVALRSKSVRRAWLWSYLIQQIKAVNNPFFFSVCPQIDRNDRREELPVAQLLTIGQRRKIPT